MICSFLKLEFIKIRYVCNVNSRDNESIRENTTQNGDILRTGVNLYGVCLHFLLSLGQ